MSSKKTSQDLKNKILNGEDIKLDFYHKTISNNTILKILDLYSNLAEQPLTAGQIAQRTSTPKPVVQFLVKDVFDLKHDELPPSNKDDISDAVDDLIERKDQIQSEFFKKTSAIQATHARNWEQLISGQVNPIEAVLQKYKKPCNQRTTGLRKTYQDGGSTLVFGCSDWHYGIYADGNFLQRGEEWSLDKTIQAVAEYGHWICEQIEKEKPKRVVLAFLGDLIHTLTGYTDKGTRLEFDVVGESLLENALESVVKFIDGIALSTYGLHGNKHINTKIDILSCGGNHSFFGDWVIMKMAQLSLGKKYDNVNFEITNKRSITFTVDETPFVMEHGYAANAKSRLPAPGAGREAYVRKFFDTIGIKERAYFLSADQHHSEHYDYGKIEGFMFPTLVGGCRYADEQLYEQKSQQMALVVENGVVVGTKFFNYKK